MFKDVVCIENNQFEIIDSDFTERIWVEGNWALPRLFDYLAAIILCYSAKNLDLFKPTFFIIYKSTKAFDNYLYQKEFDDFYKTNFFSKVYPKIKEYIKKFHIYD